VKGLRDSDAVNRTLGRKLRREVVAPDGRFDQCRLKTVAATAYRKTFARGPRLRGSWVARPCPKRSIC